MLTKGMLAAYLARIGVPEPLVLDAEALRGLHRAHLMAVPFENLSIHLGDPISLNEADLIDKIVGRRRGGFCYELNGAFACLLERLGAVVRRVSARVYGDDGTPGPPFDHLALVVRLPDGTGPWLADVGFGSHSTYPLLADARSGQADPSGQFLLAGRPDGDIDVGKDGRPPARRPGPACRLPGSLRNRPQHRARARRTPRANPARPARRWRLAAICWRVVHGCGRATRAQ